MTTLQNGRILCILGNFIYYSAFYNNIANLIGKLNFYKLIPYPMDKCLSGRRGPARQTSEKDVLCLHRPSRSSAVHSPGGV